MHDLAIRSHIEYGAHELKKNFQKYMTMAFSIALAFHFSGLGAYWASIYFASEEEPKVMVRILKYSELGPPPSIAGSAAPAVAVSAAAVKPSIGIPVPVPDAEISPEQTIATQQEMSEAVGPIGEGLGGGVQTEIQIEDDGPPPDFVPFEKEPVAIKKIQPVYPEIARRAGVEGTVWMKVWVDKEGKVRKAEVLKSDADIFNQPAVEAAMQWVFTPALMKSGPVSVWVSIPFRFRLQGN
jgi:protein TonB